MSEHNFGSIDGAQLCLRLSASPAFDAPSPDGWWRFSPRKLLDWRAWKSSTFRRCNWSFWWVFHRHANHRCWCPEGTRFDGRLCMAGFGVNWFYSRYTGELPCVCDRSSEEFEESA